MLKIGLTGGIGSGKTAVSDLFNSLAVPVIDTDVIARDLLNNNPLIAEEVARTFGNDIVAADSSIDRKKLARLVFGDNEKKQQLEKILHPRIREEVNRQINGLQASENPPAYLIIVIPLLFETGFNDVIDQSLVVIADKNTRVNRIRQRDNRSLDEIHSIINSQVSDERRLSEADDIIENNSNFSQLESMVLHFHDKYRQLAANNK